jgi:hypothetical protein
VLEVPALRAAALLDKERSVALLREILAERHGSTVDDFELKVTSAMICTAMETAMEEWLRSDGKADVMSLVGRALDVVELGARLGARGTRLRPFRAESAKPRKG